MDSFNAYAEGEWIKLEPKPANEERGGLNSRDLILRGPLWNYERKANKLFIDDLLYGKTKKSSFTPDELIQKGPVWSPDKPITCSMVHFLFKKLKKHEENTALLEIETGRSLTYKELIDQARSVACGLHSRGMMPGQVIAVVTYNSLEATLMILASLLVGSIAALMDASLNPVELGVLLRIANPHLIFCEGGKTMPKVDTAVSYMMARRRPNLVVNNYKGLVHIAFQKLFEEVDPGFRPAFRYSNPTNPVFIVFTSGTNGSPRGALISERYFMGNKAIVGSSFSLMNYECTSLLSPPLFQIRAISRLIYQLHAGHRTVFFRGIASEAAIFGALQKYQVVTWTTWPSALIGLLDWPCKPHCESLSVIVCGGSYFPLKSLMQVQQNVFKSDVKICQVYECTAGGLLAANTPLSNKLGSVGQLYFNVQMKVLERETGIPLGPEMEGELCFKSPSMMVGYYNLINTEERIFDGEGFFHTGDMGYYDEQGYVYITARIKDLIIWQNCQVIPSKVEEQLLYHPAIKEAVVFGQYNEVEGEVVTAAVILNWNFSSVDPSVIEKTVNKHLSPSMKIRGGVHVFERFPLDAKKGKPLKGAIAKEVADRTILNNKK